MNEVLKLKDIPEQYFEMAEFLGVETFIKFCDYFGGSHIYIPKLKTLINIIRDREIIILFRNGTSIRTISRKYNITENRVRKIIKEVI